MSDYQRESEKLDWTRMDSQDGYRAIIEECARRNFREWQRERWRRKSIEEAESFVAEPDVTSIPWRQRY